MPRTGMQGCSGTPVWPGPLGKSSKASLLYKPVEQMSKGLIMFNLFSVALLQCKRCAADPFNILLVYNNEILGDTAPFLRVVECPEVAHRGFQSQIFGLPFENRECIRRAFLLGYVDQTATLECGAHRALVSHDDNKRIAIFCRQGVIGPCQNRYRKRQDSDYRSSLGLGPGFETRADFIRDPKYQKWLVNAGIGVQPEADLPVNDRPAKGRVIGPMA